MIQIEITNGTPFRRRIFLHAAQLPTAKPIPLALTAWKVFDLAPGATIGTVDGDFQIGVRVSRIVHGIPHTTAISEAAFGDSFQLDFVDGAPVLTRTPSAASTLTVHTPAAAPQFDVILYRDYLPFQQRQTLPDSVETFAQPTGLYCYASMPFTTSAEALALEPVTGYLDLQNPENVSLELLPAASQVEWKANGQILP